MFAHEKLQVYGKTLDFAAKVAIWTGTWDKRHALVDHLGRAAESIASNVAEAARQRGAPARLKSADYAIGSSLECAGCLDVAQIKGLLTQSQSREEKDRLCEVTKMLIGLRKAWTENIAREEPPLYRVKSPNRRRGPAFITKIWRCIKRLWFLLNGSLPKPDRKRFASDCFDG